MYDITASTCQITVAGITDKGPARSENQDAIVIDGKIALKSGAILHHQVKQLVQPISIAVIDGMGGYAGGGDAAALAACSIARFATSDDSIINEHLNDLSRDISYAGGAWHKPDMGAALALLVIQLGKVTVANVGDCRAYRLENDMLGKWSKDDRLNPRSSGITQALGGPTRQIDAHVVHLDGEQSQGRFLLCSDGVWGTLDHENLTQICRNGEHPFNVIDQITRACYEKHASDNFSAIAIDISYR